MKNEPKEITIKVSKEEADALTSVLIDALTYYSSLPEKEEEMKMLTKATHLGEEITKQVYKGPPLKIDDQYKSNLLMINKSLQAIRDWQENADKDFDKEMELRNGISLSLRGDNIPEEKELHSIDYLLLKEKP